MTHQNNLQLIAMSRDLVDTSGLNAYENDPIYIHERISSNNPLYLEATSEENLCKDIIKIIKKYVEDITNYWNRQFHRLDTCEYSLSISEFKRANKIIVSSEMDVYDVEAARILGEWFKLELSTCEYDSDDPEMFLCITCGHMDAKEPFSKCSDCDDCTRDWIDAFYGYEPRFKMPDLG